MKSIYQTILSVVTLTLVLSSTVAAESQCKGLTQTDCSKNASCTWVPAYERKDGRKVNAFCRAKPKSKSKKNKAS